MKPETTRWLQLAQEDYENMELLWEKHRYGLAVFCAQQSVEKILKAYIVEINNKRPLKTHRIEDLLKQADLDKTEINGPVVEELSKAYIRVRYPDLNKQYYRTRNKVEPLVVMTRRIYLWVKNKLKNH